MYKPSELNSRKKSFLWRRFSWVAITLSVWMLHIGSVNAQNVLSANGVADNLTPSPGDIISITWNVQLDDPTPPNNANSASPGTFCDFSTDASAFSFAVDFPIPAGPPFFYSGVESVTLPAGLPLGPCTFKRSFSDDFTPGPVEATASFTVTAGGGVTPTATGEAGVTSVTGISTPGSVNQGQSQSLQIQWLFSLSDGEPPDIFSSSSLLNGQPFNGPLNLLDHEENELVTETLFIPEQLIAEALAAGLSSFTYSRDFVINGEGSISGSVTIDINGALLSQVTASTATSTLEVGRSHSILINWLATLQRIGLGATLNVTSSQGEFFLPNGQRLGAPVLNTLSQSTSSSALFSESVNAQRSLLLVALQSGFNQVIYRRQFTDAINTVTAQATFQLLAAGSSGELFVPNLSLFFEDGSVQKVLRTGESLRAVAEITTQGIGLLQGFWEIAYPPSTLGSPIFTPLTFVQTQLAGSSVHRETSPILPVDTPGLYIVRFRLGDGTADQNQARTATILYLVNGATSMQSITLLGPETGGSLNEKTLFEWRAIANANANAYKLELFPWPRSIVDQLVQPGESVCSNLTQEERADQTMTGLFVDGDSTSTQLSTLALSQVRTTPNNSGIWCFLVSAFNQEGLRIGQGPIQTLFLPQTSQQTPIIITTNLLQLPQSTQPTTLTISMAALELAGLGEDGATLQIQLDSLILNAPATNVPGAGTPGQTPASTTGGSSSATGTTPPAGASQPSAGQSLTTSTLTPTTTPAGGILTIPMDILSLFNSIGIPSAGGTTLLIPLDSLFLGATSVRSSSANATGQPATPNKNAGQPSKGVSTSSTATTQASTATTQATTGQASNTATSTTTNATLTIPMDVLSLFNSIGLPTAGGSTLLIPLDTLILGASSANSSGSTATGSASASTMPTSTTTGTAGQSSTSVSTSSSSPGTAQSSAGVAGQISQANNTTNAPGSLLIRMNEMNLILVGGQQKPTGFSQSSTGTGNTSPTTAQSSAQTSVNSSSSSSSTTSSVTSVTPASTRNAQGGVGQASISATPGTLIIPMQSLFIQAPVP